MHPPAPVQKTNVQTILLQPPRITTHTTTTTTTTTKIVTRTDTEFGRVQWEREWTESLNAESKSPKEQVKTQEKEEQKEEEKEEKTLSSNIRSSMKRNITEKENANNQRDNDTMDDDMKENISAAANLASSSHILHANQPQKYTEEELNLQYPLRNLFLPNDNTSSFAYYLSTGPPANSPSSKVRGDINLPNDWEFDAIWGPNPEDRGSVRCIQDQTITQDACVGTENELYRATDAVDVEMSHEISLAALTTPKVRQQVTPTSSVASTPTEKRESQTKRTNECLNDCPPPRAKHIRSEADSPHEAAIPNPFRLRRNEPSIYDLPQLVSLYDRMNPSMQTQVLLRMLRRSPSTTLQYVAGIILPKLRRDPFLVMPCEITKQILSYMDAQTLSIAAQVSKRWRDVIDGDVRLWRSLLIHKGWHGEVEKLEGLNIGLAGGAEQLLRSDASIIFETRPQDQHVQSPQSSLLQPSHTHPYKWLYQRCTRLKHNWYNNNCSSFSFKGERSYVVTCLQFDDQKIVSGVEDHTIHVYDIDTGEIKRVLRGHEGGVWCLQFVRNMLVSGATDRMLRVWDLLSGECTHTGFGHTSTIRCLQIVTNPDTSPGQPSLLVVTGSRDTCLRIWEMPEQDTLGQPVDTREPPPPEGFLLPASLKCRFTLEGHTASVRALAVHGDTIVSGSYDNTVRIWNLNTGKEKHCLIGHTNRVYAIGFDGNTISSGSMDNTIRLWCPRTGICKYKLEGHTQLVGLVQLTNDLLVSAAADTQLRMWNASTGKMLHVLAGHTGAITCFMFDSDKIVSGSEGTLKLWDAKTGAFIRNLCTDLLGAWRVGIDGQRCVAAVLRDNVTWFEVRDFDVDPSMPTESRQYTPRTHGLSSDTEDDDLE